MTDDYLWNRTGPPDRDVEALEQLLAPLGYRDSPGTTATPRERTRSFVYYTSLAATAAVVIGFSSITLSHRPATPGVDVQRVSGASTVNAKALVGRATLPVGGWLVTNRDGRANVDVGIGRVEIGPRSRLGLLRQAPGDIQMHLAEGRMDAVIWAPPGRFSVKTPSSTAVDLGCIYSMTMAADGTGVVEVAAGWVGFQHRGREAFIPAGAMSVTRPILGPGTPHYKDAAEAIRTALAIIDTARFPTAERAAAVGTVVSLARPRDALTLWHLLSRVDGDERDLVFDALSALVQPPAGVTRDGVRLGDRRMLDLWWNALNLGTIDWWDLWTREWRELPRGSR